MSELPPRSFAFPAIDDRALVIRAACVLEATAPKVGNVHPGARFNDLTFEHFVAAADITALTMANVRDVDSMGPAMLAAIRQTRSATGTNVNLGIVLLLGPLLAGEPDFDTGCDLLRWKSGVARTLNQLTEQHGGYVAAAIAAADAGGLVQDSVSASDPLNINQYRDCGERIAPYDLIQAMRSAADRDRIAEQYAGGFVDLFDHVVPTIRDSVIETGDLLGGIVKAHVRLIADRGDSLIARKNGRAASESARQWAAECLRSYDQHSVRRFDARLREDDHKMNPGTTADLVAAGLYVGLRTGSVVSDLRRGLSRR